MYTYKATVNRVVDGDTIDCTVDLGFSVFTKQRIRLAGIDTPELRSSNLVERKYAQEAKEYLENLLAEHNNEVILWTTKDDKYGRMLGVIRVESMELSVNDVLIDEGYAWYYGTKKDFTILDQARNNLNPK